MSSIDGFHASAAVMICSQCKAAVCFQGAFKCAASQTPLPSPPTPHHASSRQGSPSSLPCQPHPGDEITLEAKTCQAFALCLPPEALSVLHIHLTERVIECIQYEMQDTGAHQGVSGQWLHGEHQMVHHLQPPPAAQGLPLCCLRQLRPQVRPPLSLGRPMYWRGERPLCDLLMLCSWDFRASWCPRPLRPSASSILNAHARLE